MPFVTISELPRLELFPLATSGIVQGENIMLSFLDLAPGCEIPEHSHPHEQAGLVLEGEFRFCIGDEERMCAAGDAFVIPPNVVHSGRVDGDQAVKLLDIFSPPREDYAEKYNRYTSTSEDSQWK